MQEMLCYWLLGVCASAPRGGPHYRGEDGRDAQPDVLRGASLHPQPQAEDARQGRQECPEEG